MEGSTMSRESDSDIVRGLIAMICLDCGHEFNQDEVTGEPEACPHCGALEVHNAEEFFAHLADHIAENDADDRRRGRMNG